MSDIKDTIKIKLNTGLATAPANAAPRAYDPGTELDWDRKEAEKLIAAGHASRVETLERMKNK